MNIEKPESQKELSPEQSNDQPKDQLDDQEAFLYEWENPHDGIVHRFHSKEEMKKFIQEQNEAAKH